MANFGSSFSLGLRNGRVLKNDIEQERRRETEDKMFQSAINFKKQELDAEGQEIAGMEGQRQDIMGMFGNASVGDIAGAIVDNHVAGGGKINDQTYSMAMGVATKLFGVAKMEQDFQQKKTMFGQKQEYMNAQTNRLNRMNTGGGSSEEPRPPYSLTEDGKIDPTSVDMGSQWYKSQPKDIKRGIANAQGFKSVPSPATVYDLGEDEPIVEPPVDKTKKKAEETDYLGDILKRI